MERFSIAGLTLVIFVLFISSVYAQSCGADDRIFKMADTKNAHAELYDGDNYNVDVCFTDYFNGNLDIGSSVHDDIGDGSNAVLRLSQITNAHLENPYALSPNYNEIIYYGDLVCELRDDLCENNKNSAFIASLSQETNAHIALSNRYSKSLCCASAGSEGSKCDYDNVCEPLENGENRNNCPYDCQPSSNECSNDGSVWYDSFGEEHETQTEKNYCGLSSSFDEVTQEGACCPDGWDCLSDKDGDFICEAVIEEIQCNQVYDSGGDSFQISSCADYGRVFPIEDRQNQCELACVLGSDTPGANGAGDTGSIFASGCEWVDNECKFWYEKADGGDRCSVKQISEGSCSESDAFRTIVYGVSGGVSCDIGCGSGEDCSKEVPCPRVLQFSFFGIINMIASLVIVGFAYLIYLVKKR